MGEQRIASIKTFFPDSRPSNNSSEKKHEKSITKFRNRNKIIKLGNLASCDSIF